MIIKADLHTHTIFSDGTLTPQELIDLAIKKNIRILSITDHDSVEGIDLAINYAENLNIEIIPGIELSTDINGTEVHILAYFIDYKNPELLEYIENFHTERMERAKKIIAKLNNLGLEISLNDVKKIAKNAPICRPHIAKALYNLGQIKNIKQAYIKYIGDYGPANVRKEHISTKTLLNLINNAGGLSFIAHPGFMKEEIIKELISLGIDGIETVHSTHKPFQVKHYKGIVNEYFLLESGGSDFHGGDRNDDSNFGKFLVSETIVRAMKKRLNIFTS
jgi:predicted metal-dependent phosphoesterase TrpH